MALEPSALELSTPDAYEAVASSAVLRPAAVLPESAARVALVELAHADVRASGCWSTGPTLWQRYDRPWRTATDPGSAVLLGSLEVGYGVPTRYAVTIYAGEVTRFAADHGWTVEQLCDDALRLAGYTLAGCPRVDLAPARPLHLAGLSA